MISPLLHDGDSLSTDAATFARTLWKRNFFLFALERTLSWSLRTVLKSRTSGIYDTISLLL